MSQLSGALRIRVLERDGFACVYCGRRPPEVALEVDHVKPRADGGQDVATNLVSACRQCNNGKRAGLISLPEGYTPGEIEPWRSSRHRTRRGVGRSERVKIAHTVTALVESGKVGSLNSGSSTFDQPDRRIKTVSCDLCPERANTVHFVPYVVGCHDVVFACPKHDPGGYWLTTRDFDDGPPDAADPPRPYTSRRHILAKHDGWLALALLNERLNGRRPYPYTRITWRETDSAEVVRQWA